MQGDGGRQPPPLDESTHDLLEEEEEFELKGVGEEEVEEVEFDPPPPPTGTPPAPPEFSSCDFVMFWTCKYDPPPKPTCFWAYTCRP